MDYLAHCHISRIYPRGNWPAAWLAGKGARGFSSLHDVTHLPHNLSYIVIANTRGRTYSRRINKIL